MKRDKVFATIEKALSRAEEHLGGSRDPSIPDYMDPQVRRFHETLREMKTSLECPHEERVSQKYMAFAIADGWPFDSELGKLVCEAEELYHSMNAK